MTLTGTTIQSGQTLSLMTTQQMVTTVMENYPIWGRRCRLQPKLQLQLRSNIASFVSSEGSLSRWWLATMIWTLTVRPCHFWRGVMLVLIHLCLFAVMNSTNKIFLWNEIEDKCKLISLMFILLNKVLNQTINFKCRATFCSCWFMFSGLTSSGFFNWSACLILVG